MATIIAVALLAVTLPAMLRRGPGKRGGITPALVIVTGGAAVTFVAYLAFAYRCSQYGCHVKPGDKVAGIHPWWRTRHAWQWGGQLALAAVGLAVASGALSLAARERRSAGRVVNLARIAYGIWAIAVFAIPAIWELFLI